MRLPCRRLAPTVLALAAMLLAACAPAQSPREPGRTGSGEPTPAASGAAWEREWDALVAVHHSALAAER